MEKPKKFDQSAEVRTIARERIGPVKSSRVIVPKKQKQPKHKKEAVNEQMAND